MRYEHFYKHGDVLSIASRNDIELVNIITGIFTLSFNFQSKYDPDKRESGKRHYGITPCCATIINVHQQGGSTRADTYDMGKFFNDTEISAFDNKYPMHNIHKAIKNFIDWQIKEKLMINIDGLPYLRWPEWKEQGQKVCNCNASSRSGPNKHMFVRMLDLHGKHQS